MQRGRGPWVEHIAPDDAVAMLQALPAGVTWPPAGAAQGRGRAIDDQRYSVATFVEDLQRRLHAAQRLPFACPADRLR
ncbi:hypothetical protein G6F63_016721 [Rhizopus arrhizus]|nr:hypothetical protein G6F63_016721 [Rhizopus arrhizus]